MTHMNEVLPVFGTRLYITRLTLYSPFFIAYGTTMTGSTATLGTNKQGTILHLHAQRLSHLQLVPNWFVVGFHANTIE